MNEYNDTEKEIVKFYQSLVKLIEKIEEKFFRKRQQGLLTNRIKEIEEKTGIKAPKEGASWWERIAYLWGKIIGHRGDSPF